MPGDNLIFEDFKNHTGSTFTLVGDNLPSVELKLDEATLFPALYGRADVRPPFSLIFVGADTYALPQMLYTLQHDALGKTEIFLVPIGRSENAIRYQAVFN